LLAAPGFHSAFSCTGGVQAIETDGTMQLAIRAALVTRGLNAAGEYTVRVKREGRSFSGEYEGVQTLNPGKRPEKLDLKGAVGVERFERAASPLDEFAAVDLPGVTPIPGGVRVGDDEVVFAGGLDDDDGTVYARVTRGGKTVMELSGKDVDMERSQGEIGLFVPDAGYPFGEIPDWLLRQRTARPSWYEEVWPPTAQRDGPVRRAMSAGEGTAK
jgi:hypothetical protein